MITRIPFATVTVILRGSHSPPLSFSWIGLLLALFVSQLAHAASGSCEHPFVLQKEGEPTASIAFDEGAGTVLELPAGLRRRLNEVLELQGNGDLDGARQHMSGLALSEEYLELLARENDVVLAGLKEVDKQAEALGLVRLQSEVREEILRRMPEAIWADHPDLVRAQQALAVTRNQLGDLQGALELFELVHAAWERLRPPHDPNLLNSKMNLAATRAALGDLTGALELFEMVHVTRERVLPPDHPDLLTAKLNLAVSRKSLGDLTGALELFELVHAARERLLPPDHPDTLVAKHNLAVTRRDLGDLTGALELFELVHAAWERLLPPDHPNLLSCKQNLAGTLRALGNLSSALELFEQVHEAWESLQMPDHPNLLSAKTDLAATRADLGDLTGALELFEYVHAAHERTMPPDHPSLLGAKMNLAIMRKALGDLTGALEPEEFVHAAWERLLPPDHPKLLSAKLNLAATRQALGDLTGAHELFEYVHTAWERLLPPDHPNLLSAKQALAVTRRQLGDLTGALELEEFVHAARERLLPPDHPQLLSAKQNLAVTRRELGDLRVALELDEFVHTARERLLTPDHPDLLNSKQNLAGTRRALGDLAGALELEEFVHAARERLLPPDHPALLSAKLNLAVTRQALGDLTGAHELFELVHAAWERALPPDHPNLLKVKQALATARALKGDLTSALDLAERVHATRESLLPPNHPDLLSARQLLAATRRALGDLAGAHELFESVHAAWERLMPPSHPSLLLAKMNLAATRAALGDLTGALELEELVHATRELYLPPDHPKLLTAKQNLALTRRSLGDLTGAIELVSSLLTGQGMRASALRQSAPRSARVAARGELRRFSSCLYLTRSEEFPKGSALDPTLFRVLELLRGVSVGSGAAMRAAAKQPELAGLIDSLKHARGAVADYRLSQPAIGEENSTAEVDRWRAGLFRLTENRDGLEKSVRKKLANAGFDPVSPSAKRVAANLNPGSVLIDFLRYKRYGDLDTETGKRPPAIESLLAFVLTKDGIVERVDLGPSVELEDMATKWRSLIGKPVGQGRGSLDASGERGFAAETRAAIDNSEAELGAELRTRLLDPCLALLGDETPTELHVILDDFLHLLPIDALPWIDGRRLGEVFAIRHEISAQRLADALDSYTGDGSLLALGGADFGAKSLGEASVPYLAATPPTGDSYGTERSGKNRSYSLLPNTLPEVETLGLMHKDLLNGESVILTGAAASKKALFEHAPSARYLHLATHGWFASEAFVSTIDSMEQHRGDTFAVFSHADETVRGFAPETLCGLALAGANHGVNSAGKVPGIITAEELGALDLSNCELAVLSACETNVGLRRAGQGIQSLQTALHTAGVRTAITSLWKVDDAATRRLMELFYTKLWSEKLGKADALWQAKMALREEGLGVKDWAAWVLTGDPR